MCPFSMTSRHQSSTIFRFAFSLSFIAGLVCGVVGGLIDAARAADASIRLDRIATAGRDIGLFMTPPLRCLEFAMHRTLHTDPGIHCRGARAACEAIGARRLAAAAD